MYVLETPTLLNMTSSKVLRHLEETWDQTTNEKGIFLLQPLSHVP